MANSKDFISLQGSFIFRIQIKKTCASCSDLKLNQLVNKVGCRLDALRYVPMTLLLTHTVVHHDIRHLGNINRHTIVMTELKFDPDKSKFG